MILFLTRNPLNILFGGFFYDSILIQDSANKQNDMMGYIQTYNFLIEV